MMGSIPFEVPLAFKAGILDGSVVRFGTLLKDSGTGQILAHVQETGIAQNLLSNLGGAALSPVSMLGTMGSSLYANVQLSHLAKLVESLQVLQYATLGVSMAGIGVSAIGFHLMNKKLNLIQKDLLALSNLVEQKFRELEERRLREHFSRIHGLFEQADQAHYLVDPTVEWRRIAGVLADESSFFRGEVGYMLEQEQFDIHLFNNLLRSYSLCNAGRMECLVLSNELQTSRKVSADISGHYNSLFDSMSPRNLASKSLHPHTGSDRASTHKLREAYVQMKKLVQGVRDMQDAAATKPHLLDALIEREADGRVYIAQLRDEKSSPIILIRGS